jgi:hypothetical protein
MDDNPYASPAEQIERPDDHSPAVTPPKEPPRLSDARFPVLYVACICATLAVMPVLGYTFMLINFGGPDAWLYILDPLLVGGDVIRLVGLAFFSWRLWRYRATIQPEGLANEDDANAFVAAHSALWKAGAIVLTMHVVFSIIYAKIALMPD